MYQPIISVGTQDFEKIRTANAFYIDKTDFIREWWENQDDVTLITRPRRFGKTLNIKTVECFFSTNYAGKSSLFEGLSIWKHEKYRSMQGSWPVISLSFAGVKANNIRGAKNGIIKAIANAYNMHAYLKEKGVLNDEERANYDAFQNYSVQYSPDKKIDDSLVIASLQTLAMYLKRYHHKKVIILLDEYDTPMQEAYVSHYWDELVSFVRELFNSTFKTNDYLQRGLLTGITRISKESIFSDLNNMKVITTTSERYMTSFGFTEEEVFQALKERGLSSEKDTVRLWYDGFIFGSRSDIYNPWSITLFLDTKTYEPYWADSSSNQFVSELIRQGSPKLKMQMEELLAGECLETALDEQVVFNQLKKTKGAVWSLLVASGYLKPVRKQIDPETKEAIYQLKITNFETLKMFRKMISEWFEEDSTSYSNFKQALLIGDLEYMNQFMNEVSAEMFGTFDVGRKVSGRSQPERFYHGFVLGLMVDLAYRYHIRSNRQSGFGRYDVMMEPKNQTDYAIIMEFKVFSIQKDKTMEQAVENALWQIEDMKYDTELISRGIPKERIRHYGFVFDGQKVLIGQ